MSRGHLAIRIFTHLLLNKTPHPGLWGSVLVEAIFTLKVLFLCYFRKPMVSHFGGPVSQILNQLPRFCRWDRKSICSCYPAISLFPREVKWSLVEISPNGGFYNAICWVLKEDKSHRISIMLMPSHVQVSLIEGTEQ